MKILGIDWGEAKIGLAISEGVLAEPWKVIKYQDNKNLLEKLRKVIQDEEIEKLVVGVSEGVSGQKAKDFGKKIERDLGVKVDFGDETLTTLQAQQLTKRGQTEDAVAAAFMLQSYLERKN